MLPGHERASPESRVAVTIEAQREAFRRALRSAETVAKLEALLHLDAGELARLLGYVPPSSSLDRRTGVVEAVNADPRLGESERELLRAVYRWLVRHRDTTGDSS